MDLKVFKRQITLFPADFFLDHPRIQSIFKILCENENLFAVVNSQIFLLPDEAPREIPRLNMVSLDKKFGCSISFQKITFWIQNEVQLANTESSDDFQRMTNAVDEVVNNLGMNLRFNRVGHIVNFFVQYDPSLADKLFRSKILKDLTNFDASITKKETLIEYSANQVVKIANGFLNEPSSPVTLFEIDLNTHQDVSLNIGLSKVKEILREAQEKNVPSDILKKVGLYE